MNKNLNSVIDILFEQLNALNNKELQGEQLTSQIERTKTVVLVSKEIVEVGKLGLDAMKCRADLIEQTEMPEVLKLEA